MAFVSRDAWTIRETVSDIGDFDSKSPILDCLNNRTIETTATIRPFFSAKFFLSEIINPFVCVWIITKNVMKIKVDGIMVDL